MIPPVSKNSEISGKFSWALKKILNLNGDAKMYIEKILQIENREYPTSWEISKEEFRYEKSADNSAKNDYVKTDKISRIEFRSNTIVDPAFPDYPGFVYEFSVVFQRGRFRPEYTRTISLPRYNWEAENTEYFDRISHMSWGEEPKFYPSNQEIHDIILAKYGIDTENYSE
jgi:hypothetical protein